MPGKTPSDRDLAIGLRIREARERAQMTQEQLGDLVGVMNHTVWRYETGKVRANAKLVQLARALGVSADWLESGAHPVEAAKPASSIDHVDRAGVLRVVADWLDTPEGRAASEDDVRWAQGLSFHQSGEPLTADIISALYRSRRARLAGKGVADGTVVPAPAKDPSKRRLK